MNSIGFSPALLARSSLLSIPYAIFIPLLIKLVMNELPREGRGKAVARRAAAVVGCAAGLFAVLGVLMLGVMGYGLDPDGSPILRAITSVGWRRGTGYWLDDCTYQDPVSGWTLYVPEEFSWNTEFSEDGTDTTLCLYSAIDRNEPVLTLKSYVVEEQSNTYSYDVEIYNSKGAYGGWCSVWIEADVTWMQEHPDLAGELCFSAPCMEQLFLADVLEGQWPTEYWDDEKKYGVTIPEELVGLHCTGLGRTYGISEYARFRFEEELPCFELEIYPAGTEVAAPALYEDDHVVVYASCWYDGSISAESPKPETISQEHWALFYSYMDDILFVTEDGGSYSIGAYLKELYPVE